MQERIEAPTSPPAPCQNCGKPTDIQLDAKYICLDCYVDCGACCAGDE